MTRRKKDSEYRDLQQVRDAIDGQLNKYRGLQPEDLLRARDVIDEQIRDMQSLLNSSDRARELDADRNAEIDELIAERKQVQERLDWHASISERMQKYPGSVLHTTMGGGPSVIRDRFSEIDPEDALRMTSQQVRDAALRLVDARGESIAARDADRLDVMLRAQVTAQDPNLDGEYLSRRVLLTESPQYRSAFQQLMTQDHPLLTQDEVMAVRALRALETRAGMSENTPAAGGYGVVATLDPTIMLTAQVDAAPLLDIARIEPVTTNQWKGVTSAGISWSFDTESSVVSDDSPTDLAQPSILIHTARGFIKYSIEVEQDYATFAEQMSAIISGGYVDLIAQKLINGSGTGEPKGVVTALDAIAGSEVLLQTAGTFSATDLFKAWNALGERWRSRASWLMSVSVESQIRAFGGTLNPSPYFTIDLTQEGITRLNGRRTVITDYMPSALATTGHANVLIVGDFKQYLVAQRAGMNIERIQMIFDTASGRPTYQRGYAAWSRLGADCVNSAGLRILNQT